MDKHFDISTVSTNDILQWLEVVKDPEIPVLSLIDLGVINKVEIQNEKVTIEMTPTFVGCPALDMMKQEITETLHQHGILQVDILVNFRDPWTSDKISEKGKTALQKFGIAPPPSNQLFDIDFLEHAICPRCNGTNTTLKNTFGATLCRSIHYCNDCKEAFEQFKPL